MEQTLPLGRRALPVLATQAAQASTPMQRVETLVDTFLREQAETTAVQRFSQHHEGETGNVRERWYRDLLPATPPGPGQQYAFEVDLDACSGCKSCVVACNSMNGLAPDESWRKVGTLVGVGDQAIVQPVTTACHHCVDPACLNGCPANAYEKDPVTGIVEHLDDSCIGCRYCTLTCPYDVPQYQGDLGIVRKCDMCHDRLAVGEAPACVQSCPTQAISIRVIDVEDAGAPFPFASPDASLTTPTTQWVSTRDLAGDVQPVDLPTVRLSHAHRPLTFMLVLTQIAVGAFVALLLVGPSLDEATRRTGERLSLLLALVAMTASVAHLGRPQLAWRAVLGLGHSWLSREIVAFGGFAGLGTAAALAPLGLIPLPAGPLSWAAAVTGLGAVLASAFVYGVTGRRHWRLGRTIPRFGVTTVAGGSLVAALVVGSAGDTTSQTSIAMALALVAQGVSVVGLGIDLMDRFNARLGPGDARGRTGMLLAGTLSDRFRARVVLAVMGGAATGVAVSTLGTGTDAVGLGFLALALAMFVSAEGLERWWFFTAESDLRMPGGRQ